MITLISRFCVCCTMFRLSRLRAPARIAVTCSANVQSILTSASKIMIEAKNMIRQKRWQKWKMNFWTNVAFRILVRTSHRNQTESRDWRRHFIRRKLLKATKNRQLSAVLFVLTKKSNYESFFSVPIRFIRLPRPLLKIETEIQFAWKHRLVRPKRSQISIWVIN